MDQPTALRVVWYYTRVLDRALRSRLWPMAAAPSAPYGPALARGMDAQLREQVVSGREILQNIHETSRGLAALLAHVPEAHQTSVRDLLAQVPRNLPTQGLIRDIKTRFQQLANAEDVCAKSEELATNDSIPHQLRNAAASIQWPGYYLAAAGPVAHEHDMDFVMGAEGYKVDERFLNLVKEHQRCQRDFLLAHHKQCLQVAKDRVSIATLQSLVDDLVHTHCEMLVDVLSVDDIASKKAKYTQVLYKLVALLREQSLLSMKSRALKASKAKAKREEELANAEKQWEALPPAVLLGLAASKAQGSRISVAGNPALSRLLTPHADQLKELGFKLDSTTKGADEKPKRVPTPSRPSRRPSSQASQRSASATSSRPSTARSGSRRSTSASYRTPSKGKDKGKGKGKSKTNKGKDKGKGKGKGKSEGRQDGRGREPDRRVKFQ